MKIYIEFCTILILNVTNLILFLQFNIVNSESSEPNVEKKLVGQKSSNQNIESEEPKDVVSEKIDKSSSELFSVEYSGIKEKLPKPPKRNISSKEEEFVILEKQLETNLSKEIVNVIIMEFEFLVFNSYYLFLTKFWQDLRSNFDNSKLVIGLVNYWQGKESKDLHLSLISFFYKTNINRLKLLLYSSYNKKEKTRKELIKNFLASTHMLSCLDPKKSLAITILIFQNKLIYIYSSYLLYLLSCSYQDLSGMEFNESLKLIIYNEDSVGDKIVSIAGDNIGIFLKCLRKELGVSSRRLPYNYEIKIQYPLNMEKIDFETFGLNLCLSFLELSILRNVEFELNYLILFFGSRFSKPEEVIMARDIFKLITSSEITVSEITALLLYNESTFISLKSKIFSLHNVNISSLKNRFSECIEKINLYQELNGIRFLTDFQERSAKRNNRNERYKNRIRSKYSFML
ncbi:uncharacterized protein cubi_02127 [Cryptosporidium ubiquitum]|uniref:Uncharacterized protein n=1 Tax=Cryptosporidium ubiquitum TaxID=857276 RepID=A0A1J4MN40_9CRYT|nr:uncharacterized protein cubi_02127 [Cryptosporidium ubiquitum]OII75606.1 hypothetical protein cubi_02127 [Cryptosporidium ubiquitum]